MNTGEVTGIKIDKEIMVPAIIFIAVFVLAVVVYFVSKTIARKETSTGDEVTDEAVRLINPKDVTMSKVQIESAAEKLFIAMKGLGTDSKAIYSVFDQVKTASDLFAIIVAFGKRKSWGFYDSLPAWISDECSAGEISKINKILQSKNIKYQF